MAIDNRRVLQNIRVPETRDENGKVTGQRRTLTEENADEITTMFSQKEIDSFVERGVLVGDWKAGQKAKTEPEKK